MEEQFTDTKHQIATLICDVLGVSAASVDFPLPHETAFEQIRNGQNAELRSQLQKDYVQDCFSVLVMRLLGHRWPKQIEAREALPDWADQDGVIPISSGGHGEAILYERVKQIGTGVFPDKHSSVEQLFAKTVGESLADWLSGSFYEQHISQFNKRPIAWQLETASSERGRVTPAFSCLIYYHRFDDDLLPKIRSQYIRDLRRGYETERRTLRHMTKRSADQDARLLRLGTWLDELNAFDQKVEEVSVSGFGGTRGLEARLRQYAIDDAMQSLKAGWLRRLTGVVTDGPLPEWQERADETDIDPELRDWIAVAMENLHHHCANVGAKSPQAAKLETDPGARALAAVIGTQAEQMVKQAISLACEVWYDEVDAQVLKPMLEERKALDEEAETTQAKLGEMDDLDSERYQLEKKVKSLKAKSKKIRKERRNIRKAAKELRAHIEAWDYPEAASWTEWLGTQPLFDQFASPDGRKQPPSTIADFVAQESRYDPDINDGVRVNIAPLQKAGLLAADVLSAKDVDRAIADRADWRADERRWCREGKLPRPGWWKV